MNETRWTKQDDFRRQRPGRRWWDARVVTGPYDLAHNEFLREQLRDQFDWGEPEPTDVFVWALGEPPRPFQTKIGGTPYRLANLAWPRRPTGVPLSFLAQINFADSKDITGPLPGDLLLVFAERDEDGFIEGCELHFEWLEIDPQTPNSSLLKDQDVPDEASTWRAMTGHIHRTDSFPDAEELFRFELKLDNSEVRSDFLLPEYQGTQIGQAPYFIQDEPILFDEAFNPKHFDSCRVLGAISSLNISLDVHFPLVSYEQPVRLSRQAWETHPRNLIGEQDGHRDLRFMFEDVGCFYLFLNKDGSVDSEFQSY